MVERRTGAGGAEVRQGLPTRRNVSKAGEALDRWPLTREERDKIVRFLLGTLDQPRQKLRTQLAACRILVQADRTNLAAEKIEQDRHGTGGLTGAEEVPAEPGEELEAGDRARLSRILRELRSGGLQ